MSLIETSIEAFVRDLKKNPRLAYRKFKNRLFFETRASCDEITQNFGLLFFLLPLAQWLALPNNTLEEMQSILAVMISKGSSTNLMLLQLQSLLNCMRSALLIEKL